MGTRAYDTSYEPPSAILPMRVGRPGSQDAFLVPALVDTGADCTVISLVLAHRLGLPVVDRIDIAGVTGATETVDVYAARIELPHLRLIARVVAIGNECILGRDLLNRLRFDLDGPARRIRWNHVRPRRGPR